MPHDNVVDAVLTGKAGVGFVRTGVLESLEEMRGLDLSRVKIINSQKVPGFPFRLSTRLYPECMFTALQAGKHWSGEILNRRKNGCFYDEELSISPVLDEMGEVQYFYCCKN